jgi:hypothetical protein
VKILKKFKSYGRLDIYSEVEGEWHEEILEKEEIPDEELDPGFDDELIEARRRRKEERGKTRVFTTSYFLDYWVDGDKDICKQNIYFRDISNPEESNHMLHYSGISNFNQLSENIFTFDSKEK